MKVSGLKKLIGDVVRKEVKAVVREELAKFKMDEVLSDKTTPTLTEAIQPKKIVKPRVEKQYTKNSKLNEILNSTVGGIENGGDGISNINENDDSEYPTMGGKTMTTSNYGAVMNGGSNNNYNAQQVAHLPEDNAVKKALTRNYGDVMKAIDKKKTNTSLKG